MKFTLKAVILLTVLIMLQAHLLCPVLTISFLELNCIWYFQENQRSLLKSVQYTDIHGKNAELSVAWMKSQDNTAILLEHLHIKESVFFVLFFLLSMPLAEDPRDVCFKERLK